MCISIDLLSEGDGLTRNRPLDQKDVDILGALDKLGGKTPTEELSQSTGIPARTVRYRLQKMRDNNLLYPAKTMTHERKMGLGENILIIHSTPGSDIVLEKLFQKIDSLYYWTSTYGRYNGFIVNALYSLTTPHVSRRLLESFQNEGLISDFYIFEITDYEQKFGDFKYLDPKLGWKYDWSEWHKTIKKNLKSKKSRIQTKCDENLRAEIPKNVITLPQKLDIKRIDSGIFSMNEIVSCNKEKIDTRYRRYHFEKNIA